MPGIVSLSIELGWGMHDRGEYSHLSNDRTRESTALKRLLDLSDTHEIPITFAVVGHLFHDDCSGHHRGPYPDTWWSEDPGTDRFTDPLFYAPDLVKEIENRPVNHEIATHTHSHILADETTNEELAFELSEVEEVHTEFGIPSPSSIVMPRHQHPDYSIVADHGIDTIRRPIGD